MAESARTRVRKVAKGATINGTYRKLPEAALEAFRADLLEILDDYPTESSYLAACRALHWRTAQLRALGAEPAPIPADAPQYPPDDYPWRHGPTRLVTHGDVRDVVHDILIQRTGVKHLGSEMIDPIAEDIADQLVP